MIRVPQQGPSVGNDVVDLGDPETGPRSPAGRFVRRVCTVDERRALERAIDPRMLLWRLWAAKEAAYKAISRTLPGQAFVPRTFRVDVEAGVVRFGDRLVVLRWRQDGDCLSCTALLWPSGQALVVDQAIRTLAHATTASRGLTPRERRSAQWPPSRAVRHLAKSMLACRLGVERNDLEVLRPPHAEHLTGWGPPEVWLRGSRLDQVVVSLAHHGRYLGCAVGYPRPSIFAETGPDRPGHASLPADMPCRPGLLTRFRREMPETPFCAGLPLREPTAGCVAPSPVD